jgi:putative resolvase
MKISIGKLAKEIGVSEDTLRRWEREGKIISERTKGKHRRYDKDIILSMLNENKIKRDDEKIVVCYARVSTPNRKDDLDRQIKVLELYCASKGWKYRIISDIGSGINYNKKGLLELIKLIETNSNNKIIVNYRDRLLRFGNELIEELCRYHNVEIIFLNDQEQKDYTTELVEDVIAIITVFSSKLYGSRSHKNKQILEKNKELFEC